MGICRSHVSLARGRLWLLPMLYVRFVQDGKNHSGKCPESVSGECPGCPVSKLDILDMAEHDTVRSCPVMSGNMSGCVR